MICQLVWTLAHLSSRDTHFPLPQGVGGSSQPDNPCGFWACGLGKSLHNAWGLGFLGCKMGLSPL
jgi:hypothetical protein